MNLTLPSGVTLENGRGGLPRLTIATGACTAELYLLGAHLCHWQPIGHPHPVLWMSGASHFEAGIPIRGGVPICFPWFGAKAGDPSAPGHGVARIRPWTLDHVDVGPDGAIGVRLTLASDDGSRAFLAHDYALIYELRLGHTLSMSLTVHNPADTPLVFEEALHTYFAVSDVRQVGVTGLAGATYVDKTDAARRKTQTEEVLAITAETDRLYLNTDTTVTVTDVGFGRRIAVAKTGSRASVVWNPWIAKSKAMPDFGDDEWPGMICIETVNAADNAVTLAPQQSHAMAATVSVLPAAIR